MNTIKSNLTFDQAMKALRPANFGEWVEYQKLPKCFQPSIKKFIVGKTQSTVNGKPCISKGTYMVWYTQAMNQVGIDYVIQFKMQ